MSKNLSVQFNTEKKGHSLHCGEVFTVGILYSAFLLWVVPVWCLIGIYSGSWIVALPVLVVWSIIVYFRVKRGRTWDE